MLLNLRLWLGRLLYEPLDSPRCTRISANRMIKGPVFESEVDALLYIAANSTIRVPHVHHVDRRQDGIYIEMEYI